MDHNAFEAKQEALAAAGALYPPDFLDSLAVGAADAAIAFLRDHGAPEEVTEALDIAFFLKQTAGWLTAGMVTHTSTMAEIPEAVGKLVRLTLTLGGNLATVGATLCEDAPVTWELLEVSRYPTPAA
jgi:hypothetical protein